MNLPNPFLNCSPASEMMEQSAACPCLSDPTDQAAAKFESAALMPSSPAVSVAPLPALDERTEADVIGPSLTSALSNSVSAPDIAGTATVAKPLRHESAVADLSVSPRMPSNGETAATLDSLTGSSVVADISSDTKYIVELFSDYARRRCMDKRSPPIKQVPREFTPDFNALAAAMDIHPRDLDDDPPPLFLRKPRPAFLRALFQLGDAR